MSTFAPIASDEGEVLQCHSADEEGNGSVLENEPPVRRSILRSNRALAVLLVAGILGTAAVTISFNQNSGDLVAVGDALNFDSFYSTLGVTPNRSNGKYFNFSIDGLPKEHQEVARKLGLLAGLTGGLLHPNADKEIRNLRTATCVIDATHAAYFLERAALAITAATASCVPGKAPHVRAACAADISSVYASVAFVADYISEAVLMCSKETDMQARCSQGISGIVANTARISTQASFIAGNCKAGGAAYGKPVGDSVWQMSRRLSMSQFSQDSITPSYDERGMEIASCQTDVSQATTYLANFGVSIDGAVKACGPGKWPGAKHLEAHKIYCAVNILDILESVFMASSFIASAISHCAPATNQQALCASGAVGIPGALTGLAENALNVFGACDGLGVNYRTAKAATVWNDYPGRRRKAFR